MSARSGVVQCINLYQRRNVFVLPLHVELLPALREKSQRVLGVVHVFVDAELLLRKILLGLLRVDAAPLRFRRDDGEGGELFVEGARALHSLHL